MEEQCIHSCSCRIEFSELPASFIWDTLYHWKSKLIYLGDTIGYISDKKLNFQNLTRKGVSCFREVLAITEDRQTFFD